MAHTHYRFLIATLCLFCFTSERNLNSEEKENSSTSKPAIQKQSAEKQFAVHVYPLLNRKCFACHGADPKKIEGELDLTSRKGMLKGGESEEASIVPFKPDQSLVMKAIKWDTLEMPPKKNDRLSNTEIQAIHDWIRNGAPWPNKKERQKYLDDWNREQTSSSGLIVKTSGGQSAEWTNRAYQPEDLWAFQPRKKVPVPWDSLKQISKESPDQTTHPIDAFLQRKLNEQNLPISKPAEKLTLIRRATFDLTGLPPTVDEVEAFLKDNDRNAFEKVIDRLLNSPHYGEKAAQFWLDVVRYADTAGFSNDFDRPHAWRYRDYVIRSFNADKPYNQFLIEQLAGDEIDETSPENLIAVGFLRMGPWEHTGMSVAAVTRQQYLDDITNSVGVTFLATAMTCCKCHDHKFDPIPTRDYYRMQAVFAPVQFADRKVPWLPEENTRQLKVMKERYDRLTQNDGLKLITPSDATEQQIEEASLGLKKIRKKRDQILGRMKTGIEPFSLSVYNGPQIPYISNKPLHPLPKKRNGKVQQVALLKGGSLESPGELVSPGTLSLIAGLENEIPEDMKGRRLALAKWMTDEENPLVSRVIVNRIWQWHFGKGLAGNANNFGKMGAKPTHPELLDWLANQFVESDRWSLKKLHKRIMLSSAYQRSSHSAEPQQVNQRDPQNKLLSHFTPRRLTAEELRDGMLMVSGELNRERGGPPIRPDINREVALQPRHIMGSVGPAYQPSRTPKERNRRTIYALKIRTLRDPMLEVFDKPDSDLSCERRNAATITPQVFSLFNSRNSYDRALAMAARLSKKDKSPEDQITSAFLLALARRPTPKELQVAKEHLQQMIVYHHAHPPSKESPPKTISRTMVEEMTGLRFHWEENMDIYQKYVHDLKSWQVDEKTRALADLCLVLFNSNEFVYLY